MSDAADTGGSFLFGCIQEVMAALAAVSPSTLAMVDDRGPEALPALVDHAQSLFMRGRHPHDAFALIAHAVARRDLAAFRTNLLCVVLVLLHDKLQKVPLKSPEIFMRTFQSESGLVEGQLLALNLARLGGRQRN
jgi:hypothetical protein